jgi:hypothetical protein
MSVRICALLWLWLRTTFGDGAVQSDPVHFLPGGTRYTHVLNRIGSSPDRTLRRRVIAPADVGSIQRVGKRWMLEAGVDWRVAGLAARGIDHRNGRRWQERCNPRRRNPSWVLGRKQRAGCRWRRRPRNDELMSRKTWPRVGLEHVIGKGVLSGPWSGKAERQPDTRT